MPEAYNPIVRTFCQFRAAVLNRLDIDRHEVRPGTSLETLLPEWARRDVWDQLQRKGLRLPDLVLSKQDDRRNALGVLAATISYTLYVQRWYALLLAFPLALVAGRASRHRAVHFPLGLRTVGEMVIYATNFAEHKTSGYRWTRNEVALKVRMTVAESTGFPLEAIQSETKLTEL